MKCAEELIAISLKAEEERKIREEQERLNREGITTERLKALREKTVNWCEEIGKILEKKAIDAQPLEYDVILARSRNERICYTVDKTPSIYSDECYDYDINQNEEIYLPTVVAFFEKYHFKASFFYYEMYCHEKGILEVLDLFIKPAI